MSVKELAQLMKSALSTVEPTVEKKRQTRPVKRSGVRREEIRRIIQEEIEELKKSIIEELRRELSSIAVDEEAIVERVLQRLEEKKREKQRERNRVYPPQAIEDSEIQQFLPLLREFNNTKKKRRGTPRCFVPSQFWHFLKERGVNVELPYVRGLLKAMLLKGLLEKCSDSRYRLRGEQQ